MSVTALRNTPASVEFIGKGPLKLAEWTKGSFIRLVRNEKYWDKGRALRDALLFPVIPDANSRAIAFETGKVEVPHAGNVENFDIKSGTEPTVLVRTEFDVLPMEEKTGLPYASKEGT